MKKLLLTAAAVFGLTGTAWAAAPLTLQQQIEASRKAGEATCAPNCRHPFYEPSQEDWEATAARLSAETEVHLRQMGMSPRTAQLAAWAGQHRPYSACAHYVAQLTADYENGVDRPDYDDKLIISIEHSGTCERKNLD